MKRSRAPEPVPGWNQDQYDRAVRRVSRMATYELLDWTDAAGSGMARGFSDHRKDASLEPLAEIRMALITLWALLGELETRGQAQLDPRAYPV